MEVQSKAVGDSEDGSSNLLSRGIPSQLMGEQIIVCVLDACDLFAVTELEGRDEESEMTSTPDIAHQFGNHR